MRSCSSWSASASSDDGGARDHADGQARLEARDAAQERLDVERRRLGRRKAGEPGVGGREAGQRLGARRDDREAVPQVLAPVGGRLGFWPARRCRLPAIDWIGASELLSSWPSTRISRCQAWRSSSRSGRLTSARTRSRWGTPPWRKDVRRISQRPVRRERRLPGSAGRASSQERRQAEVLGAARPRRRGSGWPRSRSPNAVDELGAARRRRRRRPRRRSPP